MTDAAKLVVHRPAWLRVLRWGIVVLFFAVLLSWGISYIQPHRAMMVRGRTYQLVMAYGTMQFRVTTRTELVNGVLREAGPGPGVDGDPRVGGLPRTGVQIMMSSWKWYSTATMQIGQQVPVLSNGTVQTVFAGEATTVQAIPHWLAAAVLALPAGWVLVDLRHGRTRRRAAAGQCLNCGYDLRAMPERCPECGHFADKGSGKTLA